MQLYKIQSNNQVLLKAHACAE